MSFYTVVNCMDGRVQLPVISYLRKRFNVMYIDSVTEPGPNLILAQNSEKSVVEQIFKRINISIDNHGSIGIGVVGHFGCAGNPTSEKEQVHHTRNAVKLLKSKFSTIPVIGLWVNEDWEVSEVNLE